MQIAVADVHFPHSFGIGDVIVLAGDFYRFPRLVVDVEAGSPMVTVARPREEVRVPADQLTLITKSRK